MHVHRAQAAHRVNGALLQDTQQFDLHVQRQVADLIEKNRAAVGQLETSHAVGHGTRESAFAVAEKLAFEQILGNRRAIDGHKVAVLAQGLVMQGARHQFLAGAAFPGDQHRGGRIGHERDQVANSLGGFARTYIGGGFGAGHGKNGLWVWRLV